MQDLVSRAISCLSRRHYNKEKDHPDNEAAFILARYLQSKGILMEDAEPYAAKFHKISSGKGLLIYKDREKIDLFTFNDQLENAWPKVKVKLLFP